jgi:hypothetical protein
MLFKISAPIKEFSAEGVTFKAREGSNLGMQVLFDGCIDGTVSDEVMNMGYQFQCNAVATTADGEASAKFDMKFTWTRKQTEAVRK